MKLLLCILSFFTLLNLKAQNCMVLSERLFYHVEDQELVELSLDSNTSIAFDYISEFVEIRKNVKRSFILGFPSYDTTRHSEILIRGQYEGYNKVGLWNYFDPYRNPCDESVLCFQSFMRKTIYYSPDSVIVTESNPFFENTTIKYYNDSTIIRGSFLREREMVDFNCNQLGGCSFWFRSSPEKIILTGPIELVEVLKMAAERDPIIRGTIDFNK